MLKGQAGCGGDGLELYFGATSGDVFGTAPPQMLATATSFRQGEMLLAGGFVAAPMIVRVAERLTEEGGSDVAGSLNPTWPFEPSPRICRSMPPSAFTATLSCR